MATRSTIALEFADGTVGQVYCHWDGYLEHNGEILQKFWTDPFKLRELIDLGDLSALSREIGVKHEFDNPNQHGTEEYIKWREQFEHMCLFYGRDRSETDVAACYYENFEAYTKGRQEEFDYILRRDGQWYVSYYQTNGHVPLVEALRKVA